MVSRTTYLISLLILRLCALPINPLIDKYLNQKIPSGTSLRFLTFNTWNMDKNVWDGIPKIAKHIKLSQADIVALQEVRSDAEISNLTELLGPQWTYVYAGNNAIVTTHQIVAESVAVQQAGVGAMLVVGRAFAVHAISLHLDYTSYGPYAANNKLVTRKEQLDAGETTPAYNCRLGNVVSLLEDKHFAAWLQATASIPLIVAGDFNSPSHLDWTNETRHLHGDWAYEWPATATLQRRAGLVDSYRELHPDPARWPGHTWSTVNKVAGWQWDYSVPEPQDRIDYVFYRSGQLRARHSALFAGQFVPYPADYTHNDWPSDHYAVLTHFQAK